MKENTFAEINKKADIVKVVSYYLGNLVKHGKEYLAICPFHHDTHPSMHVNPEKNIYKCFSCGEGGQPITFVKNYAKLSYTEALKKVCEICSIPVPKDLLEKKIVDEKYLKFEKEFQALDFLTKYYELALKSKDGEAAREYLHRRGLDDKTIAHFKLGYSPKDKKAAIASLKQAGFTIDVLEKAGILSPSSLEDRYSSRLMFPISDLSGHTIAYSGRVLTDEKPKYINYPETSLFNKSQILYHIDEALKTTKADGYLYIVEGYMDAIALYRAKINSVVALMGTALTEEHASLFKKLNVEIRLLLDSDEPGQLGMERALPILNKQNIRVRFVKPYQKAKDSDEYLKLFGADKLAKRVKATYDPFLFLLFRALKGRKILINSDEINNFLSLSQPYYAKLSLIEKNKDAEIFAKICQISSLDDAKNILNNTKSTIVSTSDNYPAKYQKTKLEEIIDYGVNLVDEYQKPQLEKTLVDRGISIFELDKDHASMFRDEMYVLLMIPRASDAYFLWVKERGFFSHVGFDNFVKSIGNFYIHDMKKTSLSDSDYDALNNMLAQEEVNFDDDDAFDLDGIVEDEKIDVNDSEREYLLEILNFLKRFPAEKYDAKYFQGRIKVLEIKRELLAFIDDIKIRKNGIYSDEDFVKKVRLEKRLKEAKSSL